MYKPCLLTFTKRHRSYGKKIMPSSFCCSIFYNSYLASTISLEIKSCALTRHSNKVKYDTTESTWSNASSDLKQVSPRSENVIARSMSDASWGHK